MRTEERPFIYICPGCGDLYRYMKKGVYYCDWIDCDCEEQLDYVGETKEAAHE